MLFTQTEFDGVNILIPLKCRVDHICTIPVVEGGNICSGDDGSPLYKVQCGSMKPECLYGVASYYRSFNLTSINNYCNGGSYFASIPFVAEWLNEKLMLESWKKLPEKFWV